MDLDAPCLNFRDVQQALDQPGEMLAAAPDDADAVVPSSTDRVVPLQQLRITEDGVQRTAQFMADADHIAAFREICRLRRLLGFLQLGVSPLVRVNFLEQQSSLPPGFLLGGDTAFLSERQKPGRDAGDWQQKEESHPER